MKPFIYLLFPLLITAGLVVLFSCSSPAGSDKGGVQDAAAKTNPADSLIKKMIEAEVDSISNLVSNHGRPYSFKIPMDSLTYSVDYWLMDNIPSRISLQIPSGENMIWPTYFLNGDELQMVRFRSRAENEAGPYAFEEMIYLKDGKIVYCEERRMNLLPGENPGVLRHRPFTISTKTFGELEKEYISYWEPIKKAVEEHWSNNQPKEQK